MIENLFKNTYNVIVAYQTIIKLDDEMRYEEIREIDGSLVIEFYVKKGSYPYLIVEFDNFYKQAKIHFAAINHLLKNEMGPEPVNLDSIRKEVVAIKKILFSSEKRRGFFEYYHTTFKEDEDFHSFFQKIQPFLKTHIKEQRTLRTIWKIP